MLGGHNKHWELIVSIFHIRWENLNKWCFRWDKQRCQTALKLDGFSHTLRSFYNHWTFWKQKSTSNQPCFSPTVPSQPKVPCSLSQAERNSRHQLSTQYIRLTRLNKISPSAFRTSLHSNSHLGGNSTKKTSLEISSSNWGARNVTVYNRVSQTFFARRP